MPTTKYADTGDDKKEACTKLGAEKWIDFKTSTDVVADVVTAAGAPGPHAALITTPSVSHLVYAAEMSLTYRVYRPPRMMPQCCIFAHTGHWSR